MPTHNLAFKNAQLNNINTLMASGTARIKTGTVTGAGTVLAEISLPATPFTASTNNALAKNGSWVDPSANNTGTAGHAELVGAGGEIIYCTVSMAGGGGELIVDNTNIAAGQNVEITAANIVHGG